MKNNYAEYINQEIVNKDGQKGTVVSFNDERIVVKYVNEEKMYKPDIAFKNGIMKFSNETYNKMLNQNLDEQEKNETVYQQKIEKINSEAIIRNKRAADYYIVLEKKDKALKRLFGRDFIYPPFEEFKKKFPHAKRKKTDFERWFEGVEKTILNTYKK